MNRMAMLFVFAVGDVWAQASTYDGSWSGVTAQGNKLSFEVKNGQIVMFRAKGRVQGPGCSVETETTMKPAQTIDGKRFSAFSRGGPGGASVSVNGAFVSDANACGKMAMTLHRIPGPPPGVPGHVPSCGGMTEFLWHASRGADVKLPKKIECSVIADTDKTKPPAKEKAAADEPIHGSVPSQRQAEANSYFLSELEVADAENLRFGQPLRVRVKIERGTKAPLKRVFLDVSWKTDGGLNLPRAKRPSVKLPSPGREVLANFEIPLFGAEEWKREVAWASNFRRAPGELALVVSVVEVQLGAQIAPHQWEVAGLKTMGNELTRKLRIADDAAAASAKKF